MTAILEFIKTTPFFTYALRILLATVCGALIGLERTKRSKEAGIRTHCIIALASALIMVVSKYAFADAELVVGSRAVDPSRIAAQVVSGISFLGAGVIFRNGNSVKGLTTAAGIWATAAVGLACGGGLYTIALCVTFIILLVQLLMHRFSVGADAFYIGEIRITTLDTPEIRAALRERQKALHIEILNSRVTTCDDNTINMILNVRMKSAIPFEAVMKFMDEHPEIRSLSV